MNAYQIAEQLQKRARRNLNALRSLQTEHVSKLVYPETLKIIGFAVGLIPRMLALYSFHHSQLKRRLSRTQTVFEF